MDTLNGQDVADMVRHWTETPVNGYLGSSYGETIKSSLQQPQLEVGANSFIHKLKSDVPVLQVLQNDAVNLYAVPKGFDGSEVHLNVVGKAINLSEKI